MAIEESFQLTEDQYRSYVVSSLAAMQANLAVVLEIQTHLMAKVYGISQEEQKKLILESLDEALSKSLDAARQGGAVL